MTSELHLTILAPILSGPLDLRGLSLLISVFVSSIPIGDMKNEFNIGGGKKSKN